MRRVGAMAAAAALMVAAPAVAQFGGLTSDSYSFLKAVKDRDGNKAQELLDKPGNTLVSARDETTGETALHIATKRRDDTWMRFMIAKGADVNARDKDGMTPLADAAQIGYADGIQLLLSQGAAVDLANDHGETPLSLAVQRHDLPSVRLLVQAGADPKVADSLSGLSPYDYAKRDGRSAQIVAVLDRAQPKPHRQIAGPHP